MTTEKNDTQVSTEGGLVFWSAAAANRSLLITGLTEAGFDSKWVQDMVPQQTQYVALRDALKKVYDGGSYLVRPVKGGRTRLTVVRETPGESHEEGNEYETILNVRVPEGDDPVLSAGEDVSSQYERERGIVPASVLGGVLKSIVSDLSGVSLRSRGGVYYLRQHALSEWRKVQDAVRKATHYDADVYLLRSQVDVETVRALTAGLSREANAIKESVDAVIDAERDPEKVLNSVRATAKKLREYREVIGNSAESVEKLLEETEANLDAAALLAAAV